MRETKKCEFRTNESGFRPLLFAGVIPNQDDFDNNGEEYCTCCPFVLETSKIHVDFRLKLRKWTQQLGYVGIRRWRRTSSSNPPPSYSRFCVRHVSAVRLPQVPLLLPRKPQCTRTIGPSWFALLDSGLIIGIWLILYPYTGQ